MTSGNSVDHRTIDVNGHRVAIVQNSAPETSVPIVLLHGITLSAHFWPVVTEGHHLAQHRWISVSLPGHHPSHVPTEFRQADVTPALFAEVVAAAINACFDNQPAHLVGWSTGGFAALATAALHADRVASVVSIAGFARGQWGHLLGLMQWLASHAVTRPIFRASMATLAMRPSILQFATNRFAAQRIESTEQLERLADINFDDFRQHDVDAMQKIFAGLRATNIVDLLPRIAAPTCIIGGTHDPVIPIGETRLLGEHIHDSETIELARTGHLFYAEARKSVLHAVDDWISTMQVAHNS